MMSLCCKILQKLDGKTLVTAESCTGGGIGAALTAVPGSSKVYKGGIICYTNWVKQTILKVDSDTLEREGAVSAEVARQMAEGARRVLEADVAVSVTGLAGPEGDDRGNSVGTVYLGYADENKTEVCRFQFDGSREEIREQAVHFALELVLQNNP